MFHNLRDYDEKFLIQEMGKISKEFNLDIRVIPNNEERFMAIMLGKLVFIDSLQFMNSSLDSLVSNLIKDEKEDEFKLKEVKKFCDGPGYDYKLIREKGIYPYEYMDSFEKFNEEKLCNHKEFYSKLTGKNVSEDEYNRALEVFKRYCKNMGDYHDLYLKMDVQCIIVMRGI